MTDYEAANRAGQEVRLGMSVLRLAADRPGAFGRHKSAMIVLGYEVKGTESQGLDKYIVPTLVKTKKDEVVALIDKMIERGLVTVTEGLRPTLVITRLGMLAVLDDEGLIRK